MPAQKLPASQNSLLAELADGPRHSFADGCQSIKLAQGRIVTKSGERIRHVYFPLAGFISSVTTLADGSRLGLGIVGDDGMTGSSLILGADTSPQDDIVRGPGTALRMNARVFLDHCQRNPQLRRVLNRYMFERMCNLAQCAACARHHKVDARLARQLLLVRDSAHSDRFYFTHRFLADILGVRRVGVTQAAGDFQRRGLIRYARGQITILEGGELERVSCACYGDGRDRQGARLQAENRSLNHVGSRKPAKTILRSRNPIKSRTRPHSTSS